MQFQVWFLYCVFLSHIQSCLLAVTCVGPTPSINVVHSTPSRDLVIPKFHTSYGISYMTGDKSVLYLLLIRTVNDPLLHAPP